MIEKEVGVWCGCRDSQKIETFYVLLWTRVTGLGGQCPRPECPV